MLGPKRSITHCQAIKRIKGQERVEMERGTPKSIQRTQREDYKSTSIDITQERRKIQGRNRCFRTCHWRSTFPRARREVETHSIFIKNDATSRTKLRNLRQETTSNSGSFGQMETISARCCGDIRDLDGP